MHISFPYWLTPQIAYTILSAVVAILIWIEGEMLKKNEGKLPKSSFFQVSSLIDSAWFFVSAVMLYLIDFTALGILVPVMYSIYTVFGWVYGTRLLKQRGIPDSPENLVIPPKYIVYSQSFALIFFILCVVIASLSLFHK